MMKMSDLRKFVSFVVVVFFIFVNIFSTYSLYFSRSNDSTTVNPTNNDNLKFFKPPIANAQSADFNPQFSLSLNASSYPHPLTTTDHYYEGFARIGEIQGRVIAVGYGKIFGYNSSSNNWIVLAEYSSCDQGATGFQRNNMAVEIVADKVVILRNGRYVGQNRPICDDDQFSFYLQVFTFGSDGSVINSDTKVVWRFHDGVAPTVVSAVSRDKVYFLMRYGHSDPSAEGERVGNQMVLFSYNYQSANSSILTVGTPYPSVSYICIGHNTTKPSSPNTGWVQGVDAGFLSGLTQSFQTSTNKVRGQDCSKLRAIIAGRNAPYLYAFIDAGHFYQFVRIGNTYNDWTDGNQRIIRSFGGFFDQPVNSFPDIGDGGFGLTILDQHTGSDGRVRFAIGSLIQNPECTQNRGEQLVRMQIAGFNINQSDGGIANYGVHTIGGSDHPTACNRNDNTGVMMNGGSFTEIRDGNKLKILFGHTFCRGQKITPTLNGLYQHTKLSCFAQPGYDNRINRLLQLDLINDNGAWRVSNNWYNPHTLQQGGTIIFQQSGIGVDVPVDTIYYSSSLRTLFAANDNTQRIPHFVAPNPVDKRGIWIYRYPSVPPTTPPTTPPTQTPTPSPPPPQNTCTNLRMSSNSISPESPRVSITFSGITSNRYGNAQIDLLHPINDAVVIASTSGQAVTSPINSVNYSYTFTREFDYRSFASSHPDLIQGRINSLRVRVKIPGISTYASPPCQTNLSLTPYSNPRVVQGSFRVESCSFPVGSNAFDLRFRIDAAASNAPNASVNKIAIALFPGGSNHPYSSNILPFDSATGLPLTNSLPWPYILIASDQSFQQVVSGVSVHSVGSNFGRTSSLYFTVRFDPGSFDHNTVESLNQFLNQRNFFYVAYVRDSTGRVIDTSAQSNWKGVLSISNNSFYDYCVNTGLKVSTSGGDFGAYTSSNPRVHIGTQNYFVNMNIGRQPFLSDYVIEGRMNCNNTQSASMATWCYQRFNSSGGLNISQFDFLQNIPENEIKRISVGGASYNLNLSSIESQYRAVVLQSMSTSQLPINVFVTDDDRNDRYLIVICQTSSSCNLTINSIGNVTSFSQSQVHGGTRISYQFFDIGRLQRMRLYINSKGNIILGDSRDRSGVRLYNGAFLASGYIVTSNSYRTAIIRGFVYSRGIIARSVNDPQNSSLSNIYFRDFVNPILHVDYDPRYLLLSANLFGTRPDSIPRTVVGL